MLTKIFVYFFLTCLLVLSCIWGSELVGAEVINMGMFKGEITDVSADEISGGDAKEKIENLGKSGLHTFKIIASGLALAFMVYAGILMITSEGEEGVNQGKKQLVYALIGFLFINIPGEIMGAFDTAGFGTDVASETSDFTGAKTNNLLYTNDIENLIGWEGGIMIFLRYSIIGIAVLMFVLASIYLISGQGSEENLGKAKNTFLWGAIALVFLGVLETWVWAIFEGNIIGGKDSAQGIFETLANMLLMFAAPTAIFFLILGGFYMITSQGDEEKAKKGKNIIANTLVAVIILVGCYGFLLDLSGFNPFG